MSTQYLRVLHTNSTFYSHRESIDLSLDLMWPIAIEAVVYTFLAGWNEQHYGFYSGLR